MKGCRFDPDVRDKELEMMAESTICDMCGKQFDWMDAQLDANIDYICGHGTKFEDCHIRIDLCCDCFDKVMDIAVPMCKENPVIEEDRHAYDDEDSHRRFSRIIEMLNPDLAHLIEERIKNSSNYDETLADIEKEIKEMGFNFNSVPLDRTGYWEKARKEYLAKTK